MEVAEAATAFLVCVLLHEAADHIRLHTTIQEFFRADFIIVPTIEQQLG